MKKKQHLLKNRSYRASDVEQKAIKALYRASKTHLSFSRWAVQRLSTQ